MSRRQKRDLARIAAAFALFIAAWASPLEGYWRLAAYIAPYALCGWDVLWGAARNMAHGQLFDEKFLMALATLGALAIAEYDEAVAVMLFYQVGELFQGIAVGRSRRDIAALMDIRPDTACVLRAGGEQVVPPEEVEVGELISIKPGERVPLDGVIVAGSASLNTAALTGESLPREVGPGDRVISGSINLSGALTARVTSAYEQSTVARILELVEESSARKARAENFITRFARYYTPCVVAGALLLALVPPLFAGQPFAEWLNRALIFLVVSCPCALVVSVPLSFFGGLGGASRRGILIKGANYLEALARADKAVFDKTGTLTRGSFEVTAIHPSVVSEAELMDIAAAAESNSPHPIAQSIVAAHGGHIDPARITDVRERAGLGVEVALDGRRVYVGNGRLMDEAGAAWHECHRPGTVIHIAREGEYLGHIVISDEPKPDSAQAIAELRALGVNRIAMLTGDARPVAQAMAQRLGIDDVRAELLPGDKVAQVEAMLGGAPLAFVGDGINDAPVLSRADVGIAMGALGSDAALEAADVVIMDDRPSKIPLAMRVARRTMRIVRQNIAFALAVKGAVLALGALGLANMWFAVFADVGVMVLAILNAMRALRVKS